MEIENEADKMAVLKRAYADIILNTTTESAARILVSERKALKFQQSLFFTKEEALATMLRLKSVMDSKVDATSCFLANILNLNPTFEEANEALLKICNRKLPHLSYLYLKQTIKEAEMTSLSQVRRIQELEGQLNEAERTIISLREELERVNKEFTKMNNELVEPSNECKANRQFSSINGKRHESHLRSDLVSIIISKETELCRNGCTQRIRALEHNSLIVEVPKEQSDVPLPDSSNGSNIPENENFERSYTADSFKAVHVVGKQAKNPLTSEVHVHPSSSPRNDHATNFFLRSKKPRSKCVQVKSIVCATSHTDNAENDEVSYIRSTKSTSEEPPHKLLKSHSAPISSINHKDREDKRLVLDTNSIQEIPGLLQCNNRTINEQIVMKQNSEDGNCIGSLASLNTSRKKMKDDILLTGAKQENEVKISQIDDSKLTLADQNMTNMKDELPAIHTDSKVETSGNGKFLKYTFKRTRKRGPSSSKTDSISPEKINGDNKSEEKQNVLLQPQKPTIATELPRNNRRLMQVARQLVSLSEKRW